MEVVAIIIYLIGLLILAIGGFYLAFNSFKDYLEERKHGKQG